MKNDSSSYSNCSRRRFIGGAAVAMAATVLDAKGNCAIGQTAPAETPKRKIKLGLIGCGGRGNWIAPLFLKHGGYELHAVADYFQHVADALGEKRGVPKERRFSGLSGYKRVIDSGVDAVALIVPPCFLAEQSADAVKAGLHVYMAKPVAVDVPGCIRVEAAGIMATKKRQVMLVDYQLPTDPANIRIAQLIRDGGLGKIAKLITVGINGGRPDPVWLDTIENRLEKGTWNNTISIGGDFVVSYDIHAIDAAVWLLGERPISAMGFSRICRPNPNGDSHDASSIIFEYADGIIHEHSGLSLPTGMHDELSCSIHGQTGHGVLNYMDKARFQPRGKKAVVLDVADLYKAGAVRNIEAFYDNVMNEKYDNPTVRRAVDGCLTCILGRESALRRSRLTMDELLKANKRVETNLGGLKS